MSVVLTSGAFDDIRSRDIRFLQEAAKLGALTVQLWQDDAPTIAKPPKFPFAERAYVLGAIRYVTAVHKVDAESFAARGADIWVDCENAASTAREARARECGLAYRVIADSTLEGYPPAGEPAPPAARKVVVTGCYDWIHSGHVRFFGKHSVRAALRDFPACS